MEYTYTLIIPHKNIPKLLLRCINSVPERDDLQIIVVDDNSNPEVMDFDYFKHLPRKNFIFVESKEGKGAGFARNTALRLAKKSKWILFADADDYFSPQINQFLTDYKNSEADIIYLPNKTIDATNNQPLNVDLKVSELIKECNITENNYDALRYRSHAPWTKMVQLKLIKDYNIEFQEVPASNDVWFSIQIGYHAKKIEVCSYCVYVRTVRQGSLQYSLNKELLLSRINVGYKVNKFLKKIGKIEFYNETWGYFLDLRKISWWLFLTQAPKYFYCTPNFILKKHLFYYLKKRVI